jgi:hypothetical protein
VDTEVWNSSSNANENGNLNLNGNGNLNANGNLNYNENGNVNYNANINHVENTVDNAVNVTVDLDLSGALQTPDDNDAIDIDYICGVEESIIMPDVVSQTVSCGNNFNIDQVNNITDNDKLYNPSVSYNAGGLEDPCCNPCCGGGSDPNSVGDFTMTASAWGGTATSHVGSIDGDDGDFSGIGAAAANASINQEAFTQSIVMGANIQFNSVDISVVGGDVSDSL